jgi:zinc protease
VERAKLSEALRRESEDPFSVAFREVKKRLYGASSPWARTPTLKGLEALGPEDLKAFHARLYHPAAIRLAVSGDFEPQAMLRRLERAFGGWRPPAAPAPEVAPAPPAPAPGVVLMDRASLTQATVLVGTLTAARGRGASFNRDVYAMDVANFILGGGGFNSRLMREIRSNRGLAYGAESAYQFGTSRGWFLAFTQTGTGTTAEATRILLEEIKRAAAQPPTEEEVALAKESLVKNFVFNYRSPAQVAKTASVQAAEGYPGDYLATYLDRVRAVTPADCQAVMKKYLRRGDLTVFVLGPGDTLKAPLSAFGAVEVVPVPEP